MLRGSSENTDPTIARLIEGAIAHASVKHDEALSSLLSTLLESMGAQVRMTLHEVEGTQEIERQADLNTILDDDNMLHAHVKRPNAYTWSEITDAMCDEDAFWGDVPYMPPRLAHMPICLAARSTRDLFEAAFGEGMAAHGQAIDDALASEDRMLRETYPMLRGVGEGYDPEDFHDTMLFEAVPFNMLRRRRNGKRKTLNGAYFAKALGRLAATSPASAVHASLHLKNGMRSHELVAVQNVVTHGLLTMRDIEDVTDRERFERVHDETRKVAFAWNLARTMFVEHPSMTEEEVAILCESTWISRTMPLEEGDPTIPHRERLLRDEMDEAANLLRSEQKLEWKNIPDKARRHTFDAFLHARAFLKNPPEETPRLLREAIDATRCRDELESARRMFHAESLGAKETEIVSRVFSAVLRFPHSHGGMDATEPDPGKCTPEFTFQEKKTNCFTGPWLAAAMLLECGFDEKNIFYCDGGGATGTHGSLMIMLSSGQQLLVDVGFKKMRTLPFGLYDGATRRNIENLLEAEKSNEHAPRFAPVRMELNPDAANRTGIHQLMHVMPMRAGFTWGSLLVAGMDALEAHDVPKARHAFELAHGLHPASPDVLAGLARCSLAEGDRETAKILLDDAARRCPGHRMALYRRALLHVEDGEYMHARVALDTVLSEVNAWFGAKNLIEHARELSAKLGDMLHLELSGQLLDMETKLLPLIIETLESAQDDSSTQEAHDGQETQSAGGPEGNRRA